MSAAGATTGDGGGGGGDGGGGGGDGGGGGGDGGGGDAGRSGSIVGELDRLVAADPYCRYIGMRVAAPTRDDPAGVADLVLPADEQHIGNRHTLGIHGGVLAGFLEKAIELHARRATGKDIHAATFTCEFLREARATGDPPPDITARVKILRQGRRVVVARATAWQDDPGRPVATCHGVFVVGGAHNDPAG